MENINFTGAPEPIARTRPVSVTATETAAKKVIETVTEAALKKVVKATIEAAAKRVVRLVSVVGWSVKNQMSAYAHDNIERQKAILVDGRVCFFKAIVVKMDARWVAAAKGIAEEVDDTETVSDATRSIVTNAVLDCITAAQAIKTTTIAPIEEIAPASYIAEEVAATKSIVEERVAEFIRDISRYVEAIRSAETATGEETTDVSAARTTVAVKAVEAANIFGEAALIGAAYDKARERHMELSRVRETALDFFLCEIARNTFHHFDNRAASLQRACRELRETDDVGPSATAPSQPEIAVRSG